MSALLLLGLFICVVAAFFDLRSGTIPNALTYPLLLISPVLHLGRGLSDGLSVSASFALAGSSLLGIVACGAIPLIMWFKNALGGGDLKLFAALGGLLLPRTGFDAELYVFSTAAILAPAKLVYDGTLFRALRNIGGRAVQLVTPRAVAVPLDPSLVSWVRMGPCFALGMLIELALHFRAF